MRSSLAIVPVDPRMLEESILRDLFRGLHEANVNFAVLRNHETLPRSVGARDLDLVVEPRALRAAVSVVKAIADAENMRFANFFKDERLTQFTLYKRLGSSALFEIKIDFFTSSQVYGIEVLSASEMLEETWDHKGIPVVSDTIKLLDKWIFHLLVGKPLHPKYAENFGSIAAEKPRKSAIFSKLQLLFGRSVAEDLIAGLVSGQADVLVPLKRRVRVRALMRLWFAQGLSALGRTFEFVVFRVRDRIQPAGTFLSISGPDGCGKTTVIDILKAQLESVFGERSVHYRHFRPATLPRIASIAKSAKAIDDIDEDYQNPHRAKPSGLFGSLARAAYYWFDYQLGYFSETLGRLMRREVVMFDRYIFDMVADPGRSRIALPDRVLRNLARLTIRPRFAFYIRVPAKVVRERKQELPLETIQDLNLRYQDLANRDLLAAVDNLVDAETAAATILDTIVAERDQDARRKIAEF